MIRSAHGSGLTAAFVRHRRSAHLCVLDDGAAFPRIAPQDHGFVDQDVLGEAEPELLTGAASSRSKYTHSAATVCGSRSS